MTLFYPDEISNTLQCDQLLRLNAINQLRLHINNNNIPITDDMKSILQQILDTINSTRSIIETTQPNDGLIYISDLSPDNANAYISFIRQHITLIDQLYAIIPEYIDLIGHKHILTNAILNRSDVLNITSNSQ